MDSGAFVVSLDFELFWGMRDVVSLAEYRSNIEGVHDAVPRTLDLFARYQTHATWACVGLVLAEDRDEAHHFAPPAELRPSYDRQQLSPYGVLDDGVRDEDARCYFAPKLVDEIQSRPHQEIGTHTFSHFYARESGQSPEQFDADLAASVAISKARGIVPTSLVFPRNQCNNRYLPLLRRHGIQCYRGVGEHWVLQAGRSRLGTTLRRGVRLADNYAPLCREASIPLAELRGDPIDAPGTRFLRPFTPRFARLDRLREHRIRGEMERAARRGGLYHLWWHPHNFGAHPRENLEFLERILLHAKRLSETQNLRSMNMAEVRSAHQSG